MNARIYLPPQYIATHRLLLASSKAVPCCRCFPPERERGRSISITCHFLNKTCWQKILPKKARKSALSKCIEEKNGQFCATNENSHLKYYSNHLCVRNLEIMSLHFTNSGPEPAPAEWARTPATDRRGLSIGPVGSFGDLVESCRLSSLHTFWVKPLSHHLVTPPQLGSSSGKYFRTPSTSAPFMSQFSSAGGSGTSWIEMLS